MSPLATWFATRSLREKRLLLVMAALLVLTIIWAGIIRPVGDGLASARERYADATVRLGETTASVDAVRAAQRNRPQPLTGTLADAVRGYATQAGFSVASLDEPSPDRVHLTIQSARAGALTAWLARLEREGVLVDAARLSDNGDRTVAADLTLKARQS